ncbi:MAG TPA: MraY family glycosyltransferase [Phycisphaerales bacterium]|nr:MraY family glycosyltransferase [Phycisphaerales bacterium]
MPSLCLSLILVGLLVGWPATWLARAIGRRMNAMDAGGVAGQVKAPARRVPNTGGIGIFLAVALPLLLGLGMVQGMDASATAQWRTDFSFLPADLHDYVAGIQQQTPAALALLGGLLVLHVIGLIDDRTPLGPLVKMVPMLVIAAAVVAFTDTRLLTLLDGHAGGRWASIAVTVVWIVVITNAFNFLDNMDGLSGGVAAIAGAFFLITALVAGQWFVAAMLALLVGALLGFLRYNFPWGRAGASVFMGDGGSLVVGFLLAFLSVRITYLPVMPQAAMMTPGTPIVVAPPPHFHLLLTPLLILAIPLYDFCSVCLIRISQGRSPLVGDLQHFSHRLVKHGLSRRSAVLVIYGCTAVTGIGAIALPRLEGWQAALVEVQTLLVLLVIALYEWSRSDAEPTGAA